MLYTCAPPLSPHNFISRTLCILRRGLMKQFQKFAGIRGRERRKAGPACHAVARDAAAKTRPASRRTRRWRQCQKRSSYLPSVNAGNLVISCLWWPTKCPPIHYPLSPVLCWHLGTGRGVCSILGLVCRHKQSEDASHHRSEAWPVGGDGGDERKEESDRAGRSSRS